MTEHFYQKNLTLPMYPQLCEEKVEHVISAVISWFGKKN